MSGKDIAILSCKILAVYSVINAAKALNYLMMLNELFHGNVRPGAVILILISSMMPFIILLALGVVLWLKAGSIAAYMLPDREEPLEGAALSIEDFQSTVFSVIGILVLAGAIPQMVQTVSSIVIMHNLQYDSKNHWLNARDMARLAELIVQLIMGFWLFFGSRGIVGLYRRMREAGLSKITEND